MKKIGVVSDTHGIIRPELAGLLADCDLIVHAGDMDNADTLEELLGLGPPCRIVRGNCDYGAWSGRLPAFELFEFAGYHFYVRHIPWQIDIDPAAAGVDMVITGHTHRAEIRREGDIMFLNPGSAGPVSTGRIPTAALVTIDKNGLSPAVARLEVGFSG